MTGIKRTSTDPATLPAGPMTEAQFRTLYERLRQQLPWGPDDRRGALNFITSAEVLAANALGLYLLDYLQFTELSRACAETQRWSFLCVIAPLRLPTGTGSPINPIAIL
jgi:hypothetical protein